MPHQRSARRPILIFVPKSSLPTAPKGIRRHPFEGPGPPGTDRLFAHCRPTRGPTATEVRSTVETHPEEQIATIRRPTCALMEKLKITTGLPLDHSTDSLAPLARKAFSSITSTNWPRSAPAPGAPGRPSRHGPETLRPRYRHFFSLRTVKSDVASIRRKEKQVWRKTPLLDALTMIGVRHFLHSFRMQFAARYVLDNNCINSTCKKESAHSCRGSPITVSAW